MNRSLQGICISISGKTLAVRCQKNNQNPNLSLPVCGLKPTLAATLEEQFIPFFVLEDHCSTLATFPGF